MNKFNLLRTTVLALLITIINCGVSAQSVQYLPPFDFPLDNSHYYLLAGKVADNYLLYCSSPSVVPEIRIFNEQGAHINSSKLNFINPATVTNVNLITLHDRINIIFQEVRNQKHYTRVAALNGEGKLLEEPFSIDSTPYLQYGDAAFYNVLSSPDKKYSLLYRLISGFSEVQLLFNGILLNENGQSIGSISFYIPFNTELETTGIPILNNHGVLFFPFYDKPSNYRVGTTLRIYQTSFKNSAPLVTEMYLKENKPSEFLMEWYDQKNQLVLGGLYYNFYEKEIDGAMTIFLTPGNKTPDTVMFMPFEKGFKRALKSRIYGISTADVLKGMQARYFHIAENGSVTLLTDLFTNSLFGQKEYNTNGNTGAAFRQGLNQTNNSTTQSNNPGLVNSARYPPRSSNRGSTDRSLSNTNRNRSSQDIQNLSQNTINSLQNSNTQNNPPFQTTNLTQGWDILAMNKTLDYKSVIFTIDSTHSTTWKNWVQNLYIPGTAFSNVIILPVPNTVGLLNYEMNNKNIPYLLSQVFQPQGKTIAHAVGKAGAPMMFYKKNAVLVDDHSLITLYADTQQNQMGLALIKW